MTTQEKVREYLGKGMVFCYYFEGEYTLLKDKMYSFYSVRVYDNGDVWRNEGKGYYKIEGGKNDKEN